MKVVLIDYSGGNQSSVVFALNRLGIEPLVSNESKEILSADKVIFPGVGSAESAMKDLREKGLDQIIPQIKQPFLGICLGMQLLFNKSEEGDCSCLRIIDQDILKFKTEDPKFKIPHITWNKTQSASPLFNELDQEYFYFVHSYYAPLCDNTIAECNYIQNFSAAVQKDNFYGVQFHPEKSSKTGSKLLKNFLEIE